MKHIEPPENLPVVSEPPEPTEPSRTEAKPEEDVHFRERAAGDTVDPVPVSGGNARSGTPASRSLQPIRLSMPKSKEHPTRAPDDLLTVPEVAQRLRRSRAAVYRLVEHRALPVYRIPGSYRFKAADVDAFLEGCRVDARRTTSYDPHDQGLLVD